MLNDSGLGNCISPINGLNGIGCVPQSGLAGGLNGSGFIGGVQAGLNVPVPMSLPFFATIPTVIGFELDMQGSTLSAGSTKAIPVGIAFVGGALNTTPGVTTASQQLQWLSTLRARIGYAGFDRMLIYGTAGVAVGQVKETFNTSSPAKVYSGSTDSVKAGPTIGGGIEYLITDKLSIKGEGLYYDLGSDTQSVSNGLFQFGKEFRTRGAIFRLGLNYQFGFAATPAPAATGDHRL